MSLAALPHWGANASVRIGHRSTSRPSQPSLEFSEMCSTLFLRFSYDGTPRHIGGQHDLLSGRGAQFIDGFDAAAPSPPRIVVKQKERALVHPRIEELQTGLHRRI